MSEIFFKPSEVKELLHIKHATLYKYISDYDLEIKTNDTGKLEFSQQNIQDLQFIMTQRKLKKDKDIIKSELKKQKEFMINDNFPEHDKINQDKNYDNVMIENLSESLQKLPATIANTLQSINTQQIEYIANLADKWAINAGRIGALEKETEFKDQEILALKNDNLNKDSEIEKLKNEIRDLKNKTLWDFLRRK